MCWCSSPRRCMFACVGVIMCMLYLIMYYQVNLVRSEANIGACEIYSSEYTIYQICHSIHWIRWHAFYNQSCACNNGVAIFFVAWEFQRLIKKCLKCGPSVFIDWLSDAWNTSPNCTSLFLSNFSIDWMSSKNFRISPAIVSRIRSKW